MSALYRLDNGPTLFTPAVQAVSGRGSPSLSFVDPGVAVKAYVKSRPEMMTQPDGLVMSSIVWGVLLFDDPSTLNSGNGIKEDDAFMWRTLRLVAQGPPRPMIMGSRCRLWRVDCKLLV